MERLAGYLTASGLPVWFDHEIISGHRWANVIREQIDTCGAVIVVMTPEADESDWVAREIAQADETGKPILPLLLKGRRLISLANIQYENVTGGEMPGPAFMARLRSLLESDPVPLVSVADLKSLRNRHTLANRIRDGGDLAEAARLLSELVPEYARILGPGPRLREGPIIATPFTRGTTWPSTSRAAATVRKRRGCCGN